MKLRKCRQCSERKPVDGGVITPLAFFCCHACAIQFAKEKSDKARNLQLAKSRLRLDSQAKEVRKADRQRKMDVKPLSYWMKRAQAAFNAWIRESKGGQCISCGRYHDGQVHAGHYRTTAAVPELRFEPDNVWPQCAPCNVFLSGSLVSYRSNLIHKIGLPRVEWLEGPHDPKRYRKEDYQQIEAEYKAKLKALRMEMDGVNQA